MNSWLSWCVGCHWLLLRLLSLFQTCKQRYLYVDFFRYEIAFFEKKYGDFWESKRTYLVIYLAGAGGAVYLDVEGSLKLKPDKNRKTGKTGLIRFGLPKRCRIPNRRDWPRSPKCHWHIRQSGTCHWWIVRIAWSHLRHCSCTSDQVIHWIADFSANSRGFFAEFLTLHFCRHFGKG